MIQEAMNPVLPPGVTPVQARTNQAIMNPVNPDGPAFSKLRPDDQVLGSDGLLYITEINRTGGAGYHRTRLQQLLNVLGPYLGGYRGINIP
jgi:hypothetical protein